MLFSSSAQRWEILKKHVELSIKSQSDTRWESRIKCIKPLRYNLKEVLLALKDLEAIFCFVLFAIFILHSRESELYRYTLDGKSALAWELPFSRFMVHLSST